MDDIDITQGATQRPVTVSVLDGPDVGASVLEYDDEYFKRLLDAEQESKERLINEVVSIAGIQEAIARHPMQVRTPGVNFARETGDSDWRGTWSSSSGTRPLIIRSVAQYVRPPSYLRLPRGLVSHPGVSLRDMGTPDGLVDVSFPWPPDPIERLADAVIDIFVSRARDGDPLVTVEDGYLVLSEIRWILKRMEQPHGESWHARRRWQVNQIPYLALLEKMILTRHQEPEFYRTKVIPYEYDRLQKASSLANQIFL